MITATNKTKKTECRINSQDLTSILQDNQAGIKKIWDDLSRKLKEEKPAPIEEIVERQEITEGEALGKAYMAKGISTTYASGENYSGTTKTNVYYKSRDKCDEKQAKTEEMVHSPVAEHLIQVHNAGVSAQVYGKIKNQFMTAVTPNIDGDLHEKGRVAVFNIANKMLKELIYETSGAMVWF